MLKKYFVREINVDSIQKIGEEVLYLLPLVMSSVIQI